MCTIFLHSFSWIANCCNEFALLQQTYPRQLNIRTPIKIGVEKTNKKYGRRHVDRCRKIKHYRTTYQYVFFEISHMSSSQWIIVEDQNVGCIFSCISGVILFGGSPKPSMRNFSQARNIKYWHLGILFGGVPQTLNEFWIHQAYTIYHT